jgi:hypothetical protein
MKGAMRGRYFNGFICFTLVMVFLTFGCTMLQKQPSVCEKPEAENSVICKIAGAMYTSPENLDLILQLGSAIALDKNPEEAATALEYLNKAVAILSGEGVTYASLAQYLKTDMPATFTVVTNGLLGEMIKIDSVIPPFDLDLIRIHLERQILLVKTAMGGN